MRKILQLKKILKFMNDSIHNINSKARKLKHKQSIQLLLSFFCLLRSSEEHAIIAPEVGLEPTSPEGHQLSILNFSSLLDLEADPF